MDMPFEGSLSPPAERDGFSPCITVTPTDRGVTVIPTTKKCHCHPDDQREHAH